MAILPTPLIDGHRYSFSSVELRVAGRIYTGVTEISYSVSQEPGIVRGTGARPIGRTRGEYTAEGSLTMLKSDYYDLIQALSLRAEGYLEASFDVVVTFSELFEPPICDVLRGCRITREEDSHSTGGEALTVSLTLSVMEIIRNGAPAVSPFR